MIKRSYLIAGLLAAAAGAWIASGQLSHGDRLPEGQKPPADLTSTAPIPAVRVRHQIAQMRIIELVLSGRSEALRSVDIKAEIHGRVVKIAVERGDLVKTGEIIARLAPEDRPAKLVEAKALRDQRRIEFEASRSLSKKGFRAETQLAAAKAALESAEAGVTRAQVAVNNLTITAPFDGVIDHRAMEMGDFIEVGNEVARLVDLDPILIVAEVNERDVGKLAVGGTGTARLTTGEDVIGQIRHISSVANANTRTFRVELEAANPDGAIADGITAELRLPTEQTTAHLVSPAILTLSDEGIVGVKIIGANNVVEFLPVSFAGEDLDGIWLTGLPAEIILITVGQEFVTVGQRVLPIDEQTLKPIEKQTDKTISDKSDSPS